jgi:hypothetical protein
MGGVIVTRKRDARGIDPFGHREHFNSFGGRYDRATGEEE